MRNFVWIEDIDDKGKITIISDISARKSFTSLNDIEVTLFSDIMAYGAFLKFLHPYFFTGTTWSMFSSKSGIVFVVIMVVGMLLPEDDDVELPVVKAVVEPADAASPQNCWTAG
ncbi:14220_t:CDS:2 [Entrophospora sp. SA101]|nr:14220_t:CDS:2 [Entrophospora sp. SA101]